MKNVFYILLLIGSISFFTSCDKEEETHPKVATLEAEISSGSSVLLKGNVIATGSIKVLDHGFVVSSGFSEEKKHSMNKAISTGIFVLEANGFSGSVNVKAYITNEKGTAYGETISFVMPDPTIENLSKSTGKAGDHITILGSNLPTDAAQISVRFQETEAKLIELTSDHLIVEVPQQVYNSYWGNSITLTVQINGYHYRQYDFTLLPTITDFEPKSGTIGTTITLTGSYFYNGYYPMSVYFNDVETYVNYFDYNRIQVSVPQGITTEKLKIKVVASGVTYEMDGEFTILPPTITAFSPRSGTAGSLITIAGTNLENFGSNTVSIGGTFASIHSATSTSLVVAVPMGLEAGSHKININTGVHSTTSIDDFTLASPVITGFTPASGYPGSEVVISGNNLVSETYGQSVFFGTHEANITSANANSLTVIVPYYATPGKMKISVTSAGHIANSAEDFTVLEPTVTGFSPTSGTPGTKVTITGTGFSTNGWYTEVYFGWRTANILSVTSTKIEVLVPSELGAGDSDLTLKLYGQDKAVGTFKVL